MLNDENAILGTLFAGSQELQQDYELLVEHLKQSPRVLVTSHEGPDGDAIGSTLAMCHVLWTLGIDAVPFNVDRVPHNFSFLPGADRFVHALDEEESFDLTILVDCAERHRPGGHFPASGWGTRVAVVDHHQTWDPTFPDVVVRDPSAAAVGEMVFRLALTAKVPIGPELAKCCYAAIMTDTGSFRYNNTSPLTFAIVSSLLTYGVEPWEMTSNIYENDPIERVRLLARVLDTLTVSSCSRLAFICVKRAMMEGIADRPELLDGFINYARRIQGVEVATQIRELEDGDYKVSFRSRGAVNVADLASRFGGGGHHNAAGCRMTGEVEEIQELLADQLDAMLGPPPAALEAQ